MRLAVRSSRPYAPKLPAFEGRKRSKQAAGMKLPVSSARELLDVSLPEGAREKVQESVAGEQERAERFEEGELF